MTNTSSIDLGHVLRRRVSAEYGDLVTRQTGKAVRCGVEEDMAAGIDCRVTVMDFSSVRCLDFSCADEIVGKLLLSHARCFVLRGLHAGHREAIQAILTRYKLAVVVQDRNGGLTVLGQISEHTRRAFDLVAERGALTKHELPICLSLTGEVAHQVISELLERRLALLGASDETIHSPVWNGRLEPADSA